MRALPWGIIAAGAAAMAALGPARAADEANVTGRAAVVGSEKLDAGQARAEAIGQSSECRRKIKVVYAGYGETARAECPAAAAASR